ncbi:assimilatory sulfite reductase (NADPH) flavoprotein subunit [Marinobacter sp. P4B1]|uniref:assimilatory sulfite reductase (NADPH) flavoprotein subunit n=1 Tax=Marinobacter sp. P4B1 TaxID=1119533 RepID=UPI00071D4FE8|nr:assimilatory sulfite reductase (NADPH) flavoprotein subunit [Marinobacter sp. P4B1]KRW81604.1 sulfite reductase [NADPH] flavoprotein alpha-component [Marinobacter sp. P4B1]
MTNNLSSSPLSAEQQQRLGQLLAELGSDQIYWLAGYLAGYCFSNSPSATASQASAVGGRELTILFGSQTGNAEGVAEQLAVRAAEKGVAAKVVDLADYKPKQLKQAQFLALVTSTQGEGDPPDNALDFHEFLMGKKAPKLDQLRYSVLGLGDSSYQHFCQTGRDFDQRLAELGASRLAERVDCDVDYEDLAEQWIERVLEAVASEAGASQPVASATTAVGSAAASLYSRKNPFQATILTNQLLNGRGSDKEVRHIEFSLEDSGLQYKPGDALAVCPENSPALVSQLLSALDFDSEAPVDINGVAGTLGEALARHREITLLTPPLIKQWAELAGQEELSALADNAGELRDWTGGRDLLDLVQRWPVPSLQPQQLVDLLRKLPPRLYSISSSQAAEEDEVHITVAAVRYRSHERDREGVASTWLAGRLEEGATVPVYIDPNKNFALPDNDEAPVIMVGPGTGVAPFRAFMQEREERGATGDNWLIFGDRRFRSDFLYQSEWLKWRRDGLLTRLDVAFSRDQQEKRYVQHCLREQGAEVWAWLERGASLYVCGDAECMAPDVHQALLDIVCEQGCKTAEQAEDYLRQLNRDKRYQRDVY